MQQNHVRTILQILESESPCTIQDLARRLNLSRSYIKHLFKRQTGRSLGHSLIERKMRGAAELLVHSQLCIKEIAYASGYRHTSSFIRAFERYFTCAPQCYRREIRHTKS